MQHTTLHLGNEYDESLLRKLRKIILLEGGTIRLESSGVAGSQEVIVYQIDLNGVQLKVEVETYMGVSLTGPAEVVEGIGRQLAVL